MRDLGPVLADAYPDGDAWLADRLDAALDGNLICTVSRDRAGLRGITIETPKGARKRKLSTIWVADRARAKGLGARMLGRCRHEWLRSGLDDVWVTVGEAALPSISGLVIPRGFVPLTVSKNRYGEGRNEHVLMWRSETDPAAT